jgi:hypothetical protein
MPLAKGLFVDSHVGQRFLLAALQTPPHSALHDGMHLVPTQPHPLGHFLLTGRQQPVDHQPLEQGRETAVRFRPGHAHHPHAMLRTIGARNRRVQQRLVLACIQMTPGPLCGMIVQGTGAAALRALPGGLRIVTQMHMHFVLLQFQLHARDVPRRGQAQNLLIQLVVLHGEVLPRWMILPGYLLARRVSGSYGRRCPVKRSRALLASNPARDNRSQGASMTLSRVLAAPTARTVFLPPH